MNFADAILICHPSSLPARCKAARYTHAAMQLAARSAATTELARKQASLFLMARACRQTWAALRLLRWAANLSRPQP